MGDHPTAARAPNEMLPNVDVNVSDMSAVLSLLNVMQRFSRQLSLQELATPLGRSVERCTEGPSSTAAAYDAALRHGAGQWGALLRSSNGPVAIATVVELLHGNAAVMHLKPEPTVAVETPDVSPEEEAVIALTLLCSVLRGRDLTAVAAQYIRGVIRQMVQTACLRASELTAAWLQRRQQVSSVTRSCLGAALILDTRRIQLRMAAAGCALIALYVLEVRVLPLALQSIVENPTGFYGVLHDHDSAAPVRVPWQHEDGGFDSDCLRWINPLASSEWTSRPEEEASIKQRLDDFFAEPPMTAPRYLPPPFMAPPGPAAPTVAPTDFLPIVGATGRTDYPVDTLTVELASIVSAAERITARAATPPAAGAAILPELLHQWIAATSPSFDAEPSSLSYLVKSHAAKVRFPPSLTRRSVSAIDESQLRAVMFAVTAPAADAVFGQVVEKNKDIATALMMRLLSGYWDSMKVGVAEGREGNTLPVFPPSVPSTEAAVDCCVRSLRCITALTTRGDSNLRSTLQPCLSGLCVGGATEASCHVLLHAVKQSCAALADWWRSVDATLQSTASQHGAHSSIFTQAVRSVLGGNINVPEPIVPMHICLILAAVEAASPLQAAWNSFVSQSVAVVLSSCSDTERRQRAKMLLLTAKILLQGEGPYMSVFRIGEYWHALAAASISEPSTADTPVLAPPDVASLLVSTACRWWHVPPPPELHPLASSRSIEVRCSPLGSLTQEAATALSSAALQFLDTVPEAAEVYHLLRRGIPT